MPIQRFLHPTPNLMLGTAIQRHRVRCLLRALAEMLDVIPLTADTRLAAASGLRCTLELITSG
jgi:hypothetical protein